MLGLAAAAHGQLIIVTGSTSNVTAAFNFTIDPVLNRVTVQVNNTIPSPTGVTGTITSFGFNIPTALVGTGSLLSSVGVPAGAFTFFEPYSINAGGGGFVQDVGAGTGGNPNGGFAATSIQFGQTATFVFQFADFATTAGFLGTNGVTARFQALPGGASDVGFGNPGGPGPGPTPVPEPSTYGLMGAATLLVGLFLRRKFGKPAAV